MDFRRLLESWGFLVVGVLGVLYANAALPGSVVYPVLFAALAGSGLASVFGYERLSGGLFAAAGALAILQAFALGLDGGSLLLTAELALLGFLGVAGGLRRYNGEREEDGDDDAASEGDESEAGERNDSEGSAE